MSDVCIGCEHSLAKHFVDVTGVVRCIVTASGVSDRGVIGIPWRNECDCADYSSKSGDERRAYEARKRAEQERATAEFTAAILAGMNKP